MIETTFKKGEKYPLAATARYFVVRAVGDGVAISVRNAPEVQLQNSDVIDLLNSDEITLVNTSEQPQNIRFQLSPFKIEVGASRNSIKSIEDIVKVEMDRDVNIGTVLQGDKWNVGVIPANDNNHLPQVEIEAGQTALLCAANLSRKEVRISIKGDESDGVFIGKQGVQSGQGGWLDVGMVDYLPCQGALYAHNPNDETVTIQILELNRI